MSPCAFLRKIGEIDVIMVLCASWGVLCGGGRGTDHLLNALKALPITVSLAWGTVKPISLSLHLYAGNLCQQLLSWMEPVSAFLVTAFGLGRCDEDWLGLGGIHGCQILGKPLYMTA